MQRFIVSTWVTAAGFAVSLMCVSTLAFAQRAPVDEQTAEAVREHLEEAEDMLDVLLEWQHVLTDVSRQSAGAPKPTTPATTLITLERADIERLTQLLNAAVATLPRQAQTAPGAPRGDLHAHLQKAQEIARELMPASGGAVGTSGQASGQVRVDRTALLRLEVELEAAQRVAPRPLTDRPN